jgi:protein-disulfide isomerase
MNRIAALALVLVLAAPAGAAISRAELKQALDANPDLVLEALKKVDPEDFFKLVIDSQRAFQMKQAQAEAEQEKKEREEAFKHPMVAEIDKTTRIRGNKDAPITIVEYSDFQCPFCERGFHTVEQVREKYGPKVRFIYKHMPLTNLHPEALPAAEWQEAVAIQDPEKAWLFHDKMFENQDKLGEAFFRQTVKELGLNVAKAEKDHKSKAVAEKIAADVAEARKFGFTGTPGFLINGVPLRGAYPASEFDKIIAQLEENQKKAAPKAEDAKPATKADATPAEKAAPAADAKAADAKAADAKAADAKAGGAKPSSFFSRLFGGGSQKK